MCPSGLLKVSLFGDYICNLYTHNKDVNGNTVQIPLAVVCGVRPTYQRLCKQDV